MEVRIAAVGAVLAALILPAPAVAGWTAPEQVSDVRAGFGTLEIGADAASDFTATWRDGVNGVPEYAEQTGGFWGEADTLGSPFTNGVRLATNGAGDAVAVWDSCAQTCLYAAVRPQAGAWENPVLISGSAQSSYAHYGYAPAVDADGDVTVIWSRNGIVESRTRLGTNPWSTVETVVSDGSASPLGLEVDADGDAYAMWRSGTEAKLAVRPALGAWASPDTMASDVADASLYVSAAGDANVVWRPSGGGLYSRERNADGSLDDAQTITSTGGYSAHAAIGAGGHLVAAWEDGVDVEVALRAPGGSWSSPQTLSTDSNDAAPVVAVDAAGNAALVWAFSGDGGNTVRARLRGADGTLSAVTEGPAIAGDPQPAVAVGPDGTATAVWPGPVDGGRAIHGMSTDGPIADGLGGGGDDGGGDDGAGDGGTGDGGGQVTQTPTGGGGSGQPAGPLMIDTLTRVAMPKVVKLDESAAKDKIAQAGIQARYTVVLSHKTPKKRTRIGDVVLQSPKPGTQVASGFNTFATVKLSVYAGPKSTRKRCPDKAIRMLRAGLKGMELVEAERLVEKQGCMIERNFKISDVDDPQVTGVADTGRMGNGRPIVRVTVAVPSNVAKNDLFLAFRESPNELSFNAEDWSLTASREQRNHLIVKVKNRTAVAIPGTSAVMHGVEKDAEIHFDVTDVGAPRDQKPQKTDASGDLMTSVFAPKAGTIDVVAVKTGSNGLSMYGIARLKVRDRRDLKIGDSFRTTGGRLLERGSSGFFCKEGPSKGCKLPFTYVQEARASAFDPFGSFVSFLGTLLGSFGGGNASIDAAKQELGAGRSPLGTVQAVTSQRIYLSQFALSASPLSNQAKAIAAGGGNVIAAGGGNAIAAGGGNVIAAGGGNAIAAGGGNVIAAGGGNAIAAGGGNVIAAGGGNVIQLPGGGQAIAAGGGNVIAAGGGNLWPVSSAIAAGGGN